MRTWDAEIFLLLLVLIFIFLFIYFNVCVNLCNSKSVCVGLWVSERQKETGRGITVAENLY